MTILIRPDELIQPPERGALQPLVDLLLNQLQAADIELGLPVPSNADEFANWYLAAVQELERVASQALNRPPMARREVALMCRCATTGATLAEAIQLVIDYCSMLYPRAGLPALQTEGGLARFSLDSLRGQSTTITNLVDITGLHAFFQLFCWLVGHRIELLEIGCSKQNRPAVLPFLALFGAPAMADTQTYSFSFRSTVLLEAVVRTRRELGDFLRVYPCSIFGEVEYASTRQQVRALLDAAVQQGAALPTLSQLAAVLRVSEVTLRRRLRSEETSYRALRDACLIEAARVQLQRGGISIEKLADVLGFSDATAFRRSFKRCTGMSPREFRVSEAR